MRTPGWPSAAGGWALLRLNLRRDWIMLVAFALFLGLMPGALTQAIDAAYPTAAGRAEYARLSQANPAFTVVYGPLFGSDLGSMGVWRSGFVPFVLLLLTSLLAVRWTRSDEAAGRTEVLRALPVGPAAPVAAALGGAAVLSLVVGGLVTTGFLAHQLPAAGSLAAGLGYALTGIVGASVAVLVSELFAGRGTSLGMVVALTLAGYALRGVGEVSATTGGTAGWLTWTGALGWLTELRPFAGERWWTLLLPALVTLAAGFAAVRLSVRDVGGGLLKLPEPRRPRRAPSSIHGLAWRLQRDRLAAWLAIYLLLGVGLGGIAGTIEDVVAANPAVLDAFARLGVPGTPAQMYLYLMVGLCADAAAAFAVACLLMLRREEVEGHAEALLATPLTRVRWLLSHLPYAVLGPVLLQAVLIGGILSVGGPSVAGQLDFMIGTALSLLPPIWMFAGITLALTAIVPHPTPWLAWTYVVVAFSTRLLSQGFGLDERIRFLSPFEWSGRASSSELARTDLPWPNMIALAALAAVLGLAAGAVLRRRDIPTP